MPRERLHGRLPAFAGYPIRRHPRVHGDSLFVLHHRTSEVRMKRVTGIGGIFFKAKDAPALQAWYKRHLGIDVQSWGGAAFDWADSDGKPTGGMTAWSIAPEESKQFAPSKASFMVNYRAEDVHA